MSDQIRLGLVGCGAIGREIAGTAKAFDMDIFVYDPYVSVKNLEELDLKKAGLHDLAAESDFVVMAAKLTPETTGIFTAEMIGSMKPTAFFINTARAQLVDYNALYLALKEGRIAGAALDVYTHEPIASDNQFRTLNNVLLSPHLAGASLDIPKHHSRMMAGDLRCALEGRMPPHLVNQDIWETSRLCRKLGEV